jgi:homoserine kinase
MPGFVTGPVTVSVPATSANLGPGFDTLGLALDRRDTVTAEVTGSGPEISVAGEGSGVVPTDERHLVYRSMLRAFEHLGCEVPGVRLGCANVIPHGRGLGSSSAAIVAGICAARALVAGGSLLMDDEAVLGLAVDIEGHPDNVAPALYGGFTVCYTRTVDGRTRPRAAVLAVDPRIGALALVPPEPVATELARGLLPITVSHADAAANAGSAALLVAALGRQPELLLAATEDRLHQAYREPAMPDSLRLVRRLRDEGFPAVISGAGPTVLVFTDASDPAGARPAPPPGWRVLSLTVDRAGAQVTMPGQAAGAPEL